MVATQLDSNGHERLAKRKRYRWAYVGSLLAGMIGLFAAIWLGYPVVGIGLYWAGVGGMLGVLWLTPMNLFDEREVHLERRVALRTLHVVGLAGIVAIPGLVALEEVGYLTITPAMHGAILAFVGLFLVFGVVYTVAWFRQ